MNVRTAISQIIEHIPNLLSANVFERFSGTSEHVVHTQAHVADLIASVLPSNLLAEGYLIIELPTIEDENGRRLVRVPITAQPWADGEVRISRQGDLVAIVNVPAKLPMQDVPALACALMAAWAVRPRK
ncbi:Uncharacterised protein [Mycobacteroides abscessus subsp. abscessus]|uniref:hypothetical protein n=1 Tax=Mycobacteroides abscessus TaxID=36809 RepID=UPI00092CA056|nr:hypothetical protein [Mycobacteroides abscessus]SIC55925.1 Uncharacterised protein [Mycobacteroides abscessus subsp. abscessus]SKU57963.1 Uncharacterised protein [Mycobacteroides abscessus subsp. abscessus]